MIHTKTCNGMVYVARWSDVVFLQWY